MYEFFLRIQCVTGLIRRLCFKGEHAEAAFPVHVFRLLGLDFGLGS
jgi:hypothetical protein